MNHVYVVVGRRSGNSAINKTYTTERNAKLALKKHFKSRQTHYAVARAEIKPTIISVVNDEGEWEAVE